MARPRRRRPLKPSGPCMAASGSTSRRPKLCSRIPMRMSAPGAFAWSEMSRRSRSRLAARLAEIATREPDVQSPLATRLHGPATCSPRRARSGPAPAECATWMAMIRTSRSSCGGPWNGTPSSISKTRWLVSHRPRPGDPRWSGRRCLGRLVRRLAAEKSAAGDAACARRARVGTVGSRRGGLSWSRSMRR